MKSIYQKLGEVVEKLTDQGKFKTYREASKDCTSVEAKLNCAEKILATKVSEAAPIVKHNGRADNHGELFTESAGHLMTETDRQRATGDAALWKALGINEADQRRLMRLPPASTNLTPAQLREYRFLRSIRLSEADALRGALRVA